MTRRATQPALFGPVPQPRLRKPESAELYADVLALRRRGCRVYRHGRREHLVDGKCVGPMTLMAMARRGS